MTNHPTFEYRYETLNEDLKLPTRAFRSIFDDQRIAEFERGGYFVADGLIPTKSISVLREAVDELREQQYGASDRSTYQTQSFAGQYIREPHHYDRRFWVLLDRMPIIDSVRSILGPRLVMRSFSARVTLPGTNAGTKWHRDQRSLVRPRPSLFTEPHVITCLIYLDDIDERCGLTYLIPGSYDRLEQFPQDKRFSEMPGQVGLAPKAGSVIFMHAATWHRGGSNGADGQMRRVLIQQFAPAWAKRSEFEPLRDRRLSDELILNAREADDEELLELLGEGGYM